MAAPASPVSRRPLPVPRGLRLPRHLALSTADSALAVVVIAVHVALLLVLRLFPQVTWEQRHQVHAVANTVSYGLLTLSAWRTTSDPLVDGRARAAWRFLALAVAAQWTGYGMYGAMEFGTGTLPDLAWSDAVYLLYYPLLLAGLLRYPRHASTRQAAMTHSLDAVIVVVAGAVALFHVAVPTGDVLAHATWRSLAYLAVYPLGDAVVLVGATMLWLREPPAQRRLPVTLLAASLLVTLVADASYAFRLARASYQMGSLLDVLWAGSALLLAGAAHALRRGARREDADPGPEVARSHPTLLPYVATAIVYALLISTEVAAGDLGRRIMGAGAALVTVLVLARQWVAIRENLRLTSEAASRESEARFRALVQHASEMLLVVDADFSIRYASPAAREALLGVRGDATPADAGGDPLVGERLLPLVHPEDVAAAVRLLGQAVTAGRESVRGEWRLRAADGRAILAEHVATCLLDEPTVRGIVLNSRDVSDRAALERQLTHQAFHDPLTQLANRTLFLDRLEHAYRRALRAPGMVSLLFLDLDDFKRVNDSLGHAAGDALLVEASARVKGELREGDTLARLGGDEFAILLEDVQDAVRASTVAARVLEALRSPMTVEGKEIHIGVSIGIAHSRDGTSPSDLMRNADLAMYIAKTRGKGACAVFEPHMHEEVALRLDIEADLRRALEDEQLTLAFQPVLRLREGSIVGAEALVRWTHPVRGEIPPGVFIPIAEEAGLVVAIERWVLREACRQARRWFEETGERLMVGVNISARHVHDPSLLGDVREALARSGLPPSQLLLELTESVLMRDGEDVARVLQALKATGIALALDDFGTGYSSLSYLQRLPIDILKVDKTFVAPMAGEQSDPRLVRAIIALGESLQMRVVAEGIETERQRQALSELGCAVGQGYLFSRPVASNEVIAFVRTGGVPPAPSRSAPAPEPEPAPAPPLPAVAVGR